jgi:predicted esterase
MLLAHADSKAPIDAAVANHPSLLAIPGEVEPVATPVLLNVGDSDAMMSVDQIKQVEGIFSTKAGCEVNLGAR